MATLFIGTESGVYRLADGAVPVREDGGPPSVAFLTKGHDGIYALTRERALWARAATGAWRLVNAAPTADEVWSFAADPRLPGRLYLGVSPALLHRSDDGGASWTACESIRRIPGYERWTFPPPPHIPHVRSIALDPDQPGALYIGVEEGGVYHSRDGGDTWTSLNEGLYWDVHTVTPAGAGDRLYATTGGGFYRSDDGGAHWRHLTTGLDRGYTVPFLVMPGRQDRIFTVAAATPPPGWRNGANAALYRSDDGGDRWARLGEGLPESFDVMVPALTLDEAGSLYAASGNRVFVSRDQGERWQTLADDLPAGRALAAA